MPEVTDPIVAVTDPNVPVAAPADVARAVPAPVGVNVPVGVVPAVSFYYQYGHMLDYTPTVDTPVGTVVIVNKLVGVATHYMPAHRKGALAVRGIVRLPKDAADVFAPGTTAAFDPATKKLKAGATAIGRFTFDGAPAGSEYAEVLLNEA